MRGVLVNRTAADENSRCCVVLNVIIDEGVDMDMEWICLELE